MKKKIFGITLAVCLIVLSIASTTMAYFTDTDIKDNTFTAGNVDIKLTEDTTFASGNVYPGKQIGTAAKVANVGSEAAYVGGIITVNKVLTSDDVTALFGLTSFKYAVSGTTTTVYVVNDTSFTKDDAPIVLYSSINVPKEWDNTKMNSIFGDPKLEIIVKAYATQTVGFADGIDTAAEALAVAFPGVWDNLPNG